METNGKIEGKSVVKYWTYLQDVPFRKFVEARCNKIGISLYGLGALRDGLKCQIRVEECSKEGLLQEST